MVERWLLTLCLLFPVTATAAAAKPSTDGGQPLHVLVVHAYSYDYAWTDGQHEGFTTTLERDRRQPLRISVEYLDTKRRPLDASYGEAFARFLKLKYMPGPPDAIYVTDDNGLLFARDYLQDTFTAVPIFFSGVNDYAVLYGLDGNRITGVFEKKDILRNLELLDMFHSAGNKLIVLGDGSHTYRAIEADIRSALLQRKDVFVEWVVGSDMRTMEQKLRLNPWTPVLLTTLGGMKDAQGTVLPLPEILRRIRAASRGLIVSMEDAYLADGIQGGYVTSSLQQGAVAARLLTAWLDGVPLSDVKPVLDSPNEYVFNGTALNDAGLAVPDSVRPVARIVNPVPGFFERNQSLLLSFIVILSGVLMFSVFLLVINIGRKYE